MRSAGFSDRLGCIGSPAARPRCRRGCRPPTSGTGPPNCSPSAAWVPWMREVLRAGRAADVRTCGRPDVRRAAPGLRGRLDDLQELPDLGCPADLHAELVEDRLQVAHERLLLLWRVPDVEHVQHVVDGPGDVEPTSGGMPELACVDLAPRVEVRVADAGLGCAHDVNGESHRGVLLS